MAMTPAALQLAGGIALIGASVWYMRTYGTPPILTSLGGAAEEGSLRGFPECEYGSFAWSFVMCYGKQAAVLLPAVGGIVLVGLGIQGLVKGAGQDKEEE